MRGFWPPEAALGREGHAAAIGANPPVPARSRSARR